MTKVHEKFNFQSIHNFLKSIMNHFPRKFGNIEIFICFQVLLTKPSHVELQKMRPMHNLILHVLFVFTSGGEHFALLFWMFDDNLRKY